MGYEPRCHLSDRAKILEVNPTYFKIISTGVGTKIDPTLCRGDRMVGHVLGAVGTLPNIYVELEISFYLLRRLVGVRAEGDRKGAKVRCPVYFYYSITKTITGVVSSTRPLCRLSQTWHHSLTITTQHCRRRKGNCDETVWICTHTARLCKLGTYLRGIIPLSILYLFLKFIFHYICD